MLIDVLVSVIGLLITSRILSRLENEGLKITDELYFVVGIFQITTYYFLFFKELYLISFIYIGLILIILIAFNKILLLLRIFFFERDHLILIDHLILHIKSGKSPLMSANLVAKNFNRWQKVTYFEISKCEMAKISTKQSAKISSFNLELQNILNSKVQVIEKLQTYRRHLVLIYNLRCKANQAARSSRSQALVSSVLFLVFTLMSHFQLNMRLDSTAFLLASVLFFAGFILVFRIGGHIKWKT